MLLEIRWHSRGGLGALTSARILAEAALELHYWSQAFPEYGPERAGAPMMCFDRLSTHKIFLHCGIHEPDIVVVLDAALLETIPVTEGLKPMGLLIVNTDKSAAQVAQRVGSRAQSKASKPSKVITLNATAIAEAYGCLKEKRPMPNSAMLGALLQLLGGERLVELGKAHLSYWFSGGTLIRNTQALTQGAKAVEGLDVPKRFKLQ